MYKIGLGMVIKRGRQNLGGGVQVGGGNQN